MGSIAAYRWFEWGYQETLVHARLGHDPDAQAWINHPGEVIHSGYGRPSYWGGSASVPRVQQYRDLALVVFDGVPPQPDLTHAFFPRAAFDLAGLSGDTAWASAGEARLLLRASGPPRRGRRRPQRRLRAPPRGPAGLVAPPPRLGRAPRRTRGLRGPLRQARPLRPRGRHHGGGPGLRARPLPCERRGRGRGAPARSERLDGGGIADHPAGRAPRGRRPKGPRATTA
jgi:hypothetical protein